MTFFLCFFQDLRKITPTSFQPHMTNISNSSHGIFQVRATKSKQYCIHGSPIAITRNDSSEYGASIDLDPQWGMCDDNDFGSERDH